jgi:hypothetical protein
MSPELFHSVHLTCSIAVHGCPWAAEALNLPPPISDVFHSPAGHPSGGDEVGLALATGKSVLEIEEEGEHSNGADGEPDKGPDAVPGDGHSRNEASASATVKENR